jgi:hypothetical protein
MRKFISIAAICGTALSPILTTAAMAFTVGTATVTDPTPAPASAATLAAMTTQCNAMAAAHDTGNGDIWTGVVSIGAVSLFSGPTETGTRTKTNIVGTGTFTPGTTSIVGDPFRIGGSVNMFGDQYATSGSWSDSTYDFTASFDTTFAHAYSCAISQEVYHAAVVHPYYEGVYQVYGDFGNSEDAVRGECYAYSQKGPPAVPTPTVPWWGEPFRGGNVDPTSPGYGPHCIFDGTPPHTDPAFWDPAVLRFTESGSVNQAQTDVLSGHENHGGPVQAPGGNYHVGQTVICISPTTSTQVKKGVPGTWVAKNGYTGNKCTTDWFQGTGIYAGGGAQWGAGTESSNGTYISVPNYVY